MGEHGCRLRELAFAAAPAQWPIPKPPSTGTTAPVT